MKGHYGISVVTFSFSKKEGEFYQLIAIFPGI